jgi:membrane fusion protein (multidrug efflux system)
VRNLIYLISGLLLLVACQREDQGSELEISVPVSITEIKPGTIEEFITTTANAIAIKNVTLKSEIEGIYHLMTNKANSQTYSPGDFVRQGTVIIDLDNPEFENNIGIESQKLNLDISKREFEKQESLYSKGGVTLRELKNSEKIFMDARYAYENAMIQLQKLKIKTPFDGIIVDLPYYTAGTKVSSGQTMLQLMDYSNLYADVYYPSKELNRIKVGQKLRIMHHSLISDTLRGVVKQVSPALDPQTRSFEAGIIIDNPNFILRPGMFVKVETIVAWHDSTIVIPKDIVLSKRRGKTVFIVDKGAAFERVINTGLENEYELEVIEGLEIGEQLVIKGFETLRDHSRVKIVR